MDVLAWCAWVLEICLGSSGLVVQIGVVRDWKVKSHLGSSWGCHVHNLQIVYVGRTASQTHISGKVVLRYTLHLQKQSEA